MDTLNILFQVADVRAGKVYAAELPAGGKVLLKRYDGGADESEARRSHEARLFARQYSGRIATLAPGFTLRDVASAMVLSPFDGICLTDFLRNGKPPLAIALKIALGIAEGLADLHTHDICHNDVHPKNLLVQPDTGTILFVDCSASYSHGCKSDRPPAPADMDSLPYRAPESFDRTPAFADERADLYGLGVIFYQLVTACLPLSATDPLEWRHAHLVRSPLAPILADPDVPQCVSDVVMALLEKLPGDRYQSAAGVCQDLQHIIDRLAGGMLIDLPVLRRTLALDKFRIPDVLYGREACDANLDAVLNRVIATRSHAVALIIGEPGSGKTALIRQFQRRRAGEATFGTASFDPYARRSPYRAVAHAFASWIDAFLHREESEIEGLRERLGATLGSNGKLLTSLVPSLEQLIGPQPDVAEIPPAQASSRFRLAWSNFLRAISCGPLPLVLILDDIHWADPTGLDMLEDLFKACEFAAVLIVVAFNAGDERQAPGVRELLARRELKGHTLQRIELPNLDPEAVHELLHEMVRRRDGQTARFAQHLLQETGGNPLAIRIALERLHETGNLWFSHVDRRWLWKDSAIASSGSGRDVLASIREVVRHLDPDTGHVISRAAFIAEECSISMLSELCRQSQASTSIALGKAARLGIVTVSGDLCRFRHGRYRETALQLLSDDEYTGLHLRLARLYPDDETSVDPEQLFDVVYHFNQAFDGLTDAADIERAGRLNLLAAQRTRRSNAYGEASQYYSQALRLIDTETWQTRYRHALTTSLEFAECMYLAGRAKDAESVLDRIEGKLVDNADLEKVYLLRIWLHELSGRYDLALGSALQVLAQVGAGFPATAEQVQHELAQEHSRLMARLEGLDFESFADHPGFTDETPHVAINLMAESLLPAYLVDLPLFYLISLRGANLLLDAPSLLGSPALLASTGYYLAKLAGKTTLAWKFSDLSVRLSRKPSEIRWRGEMLLNHADHVNPRLRHISSDLPLMEEGLQWCVETGDLAWIGIGCFAYPFQAFAKGDVLEDVLKLTERFAAQALAIGNKPVHLTVLLEGQAVKCLLGRTDSATSFSDGQCSESATVEALKHPFFSPGYLHYHVMKQVACFLAGDQDEAYRSAAKVHPYLPQLHGFPLEVVHTLFYALTMIFLLRSNADPTRAERFRQKIDELVVRVSGWADDCPLNWRHVERLLLAELAQDASDPIACLRLYEEAVADARRGGFLQHQALAGELAAAFCLAQGLRKAAGVYANDAVACYERWGAAGKVAELRVAWADILQEVTAHQRAQPDAFALSQAIQAISGEIALAPVLDAAMRVLLEMSKAQSGRIVSSEDDGCQVLAAGRVEDGSIKVSPFPGPVEEVALMTEALGWVKQTRKHLLLRNDTSDDGAVAKCLLCYPLCRKSSLLGVIFLERFDAPDGFDEALLPVIEVISSQIAISLENARLYTELANEVALKRNAEQKVSYVSSHDALTGLPNRSMLMEHLGHFICHARHDTESCAVLVVHLAGLKETNDAFGRMTGDRLLELVCERLQHCCQDEGMLARIGGNQFAAMIPFLRSEVEPAHVAQRLLDVLALPFIVGTHQLHVEACVGISLYPADGREPEPLLGTAETALFFARQRGHGTYRFFETGLNDMVQRRLASESTLRTAFASNALRLYYQPQVHLGRSRIYSAEALLRLEVAGQPAVSCGALLHAVEETSLILAIGEWTIRQACEDLKQWQTRGFEDMRVAVNLSPRQFLRPNFREWLERVLQEQSINPSTLNLEITEGTLMEHSAENRDLLESLRAMGIQLSIDDFGTGYSSLSYLQRFPVHELKIDQAFIRGIHQNEGDTALVSAIAAMGRSLRLDVLAEGVETAVQEKFLRDVGCTAVQGYLYGKAMPAQAFGDLLKAGANAIHP